MRFFILLTFAALSAYAEEGKLTAIKTENEITAKVGLVLSQSGQCSGAVIGDRYILTAAHCVFDQATNELRPDIFFVPSINTHIVGHLERAQLNSEYRRIDAKRAYITNYWLDEADRNYRFAEGSNKVLMDDLAIIELESTVAEHLGQFAIADLDSHRFLVLASNAYGFPSGKSPQFSLWSSQCFLDLADVDMQLTSYCTVTSGMSGGPVIVNGKIFAVAAGATNIGDFSRATIQPIYPELLEDIESIRLGTKDGLENFEPFEI